MGAPDQIRHCSPDGGGAGSGVAEHRFENHAVEHALHRNVVERSSEAGNGAARLHQRFAMMRSGFANERAVDIEENQRFPRRPAITTHLHYYSGMEKRFGDKILRLTTGDITKVQADAIVNAANSALAGGGGVDGAIHRAGGPSIMEELNRMHGCPTGSAVATGAGRLAARYVFHAVGPVYRDGKHGEAELLASCYRTALRMAEDRGLGTVAFPSISTGVYGYPVEDAARVALGAVAAHLSEAGGSVREVTFVLFDRRTYDAYSNALEG